MFLFITLLVGKAHEFQRFTVEIGRSHPVCPMPEHASQQRQQQYEYGSQNEMEAPMVATIRKILRENTLRIRSNFDSDTSQIRDRQISLCVGMPMSINDDDCTLESLTLEDFPSESRETRQYIIAQANLSRTGMF